MRLSQKRLFGVLIVLLIVSMACSMFGGEKTETESNPDKDSEYLDEEYRSEGGGFSIRKAKGYEFNDVIGIVNMIAPGGNDQVGPGIMVLGGLTIKGTTNDDLMTKVGVDSGELEVKNPKKIKIAGVDAISADISGNYEGQDIKGKLAVAMVTDEQQFTIMGFSPADKWKDVSPVYDAVLGSVSFFEPDPEAGLTMEEDWEILPEKGIPAEDSGESELPVSPEYEIPTARPGEIRQWAVSARASSQYGNPDWAASRATGAPDVFDCGDDTNAWASYYSDTVEWIELTYETPVTPTEINIYQSYNPSQVVEVLMTATDGSKYIAWEGYPEEVENCPDLMAISLELTKKIMVNKVRITIDQRVLGWGWNEIDAVELVGTNGSGSTSSSSGAVQPTEKASSSTGSSSLATGKPAPTNYTGWMAGKNYQGYANVEIGETKESELDKLIGLKGKKSTENWKPRPDHKDTYIYEFGSTMKVYIGVLTDGVVYKKSIMPVDVYSKDFKLDTVTRANYEKLDAAYKKDKVIYYADMANLLKSPGFIRESYEADGVVKTMYQWYAPNGDKMSGFFLDGALTGMAGLVFIPAE
ncbi:MAG: hypothetical protein GX577_01700 [Leptolinea sp.]|nr:hypothetical protein [Leptolinea sp.]